MINLRPLNTQQKLSVEVTDNNGEQVLNLKAIPELAEMMSQGDFKLTRLEAIKLRNFLNDFINGVLTTRK